MSVKLKVYVVNFNEILSDERIISSGVVGIYDSIEKAQTAIQNEVDKFKITVYDKIEFTDKAAYVVIDNMNGTMTIYSWEIFEAEVQ